MHSYNTAYTNRATLAGLQVRAHVLHTVALPCTACTTLSTRVVLHVDNVLQAAAERGGWDVARHSARVAPLFARLAEERTYAWGLALAHYRVNMHEDPSDEDARAIVSEMQ